MTLELTDQEVLELPQAQEARKRIDRAVPEWWPEREEHIDLVTVLTVRVRMRTAAADQTNPVREP